MENGNLKKVLELFYLLNDKHTKTANELNLEKKYIIKLQSELNNLESILK
ncbi:MAG: hypothetical protein LBQ24_04235 [Candidatus Peribacteria bacterium]|nr:hypothetical protein [Candidatus Peribacteria bacterium]